MLAKNMRVKSEQQECEYADRQLLTACAAQGEQLVRNLWKDDEGPMDKCQNWLLDTTAKLEKPKYLLAADGAVAQLLRK